MPSWEKDIEKPRADELKGEEGADKIAQTYWRLFNTFDGKEALKHMRSITKERAAGPLVPESALKHFAGQVYFVDQIERLIARGEQAVLKSRAKEKTPKAKKSK